ncbi:hypothetical protein ACIQU2_19610 [Pseudomonas sp. NPDC098740]|uniref:hypothetical protein n=1 Tax=Pseudomonas sp. NPDC098740 TaxID=3364486 RepID=UPI00383BED49
MNLTGQAQVSGHRVGLTAFHPFVDHVADLHHAAVDLFGHRALLLGGRGDLGAEATRQDGVDGEVVEVS